jgi:signal transduction histidine kinase
MRIRQQLLLVVFGAILLPLAVVMFLVRTEMTQRLTGQHQARVTALIGTVTGRLNQAGLRRTAASLVDILKKDNRFRLGLGRGPGGAEYVRDFGRQVLLGAGTDILQVQDEAGRVVTSRHFRLDFGRRDPRFPGLEASDSLLFAEMRVPDGTVTALVHVQPFALSGDTLWLTMGVRVDDAFFNLMAPDSAMTVGLIREGVLLAGRSVGGLTRDLPARYLALNETRPSRARVRVAHDSRELTELVDSLDRWLLGAFAVVALASVLLAWYVAKRFTRPISELAEASGLVELKRPGARLFARRRDEIGQLSRTLDTMVQRLRVSAARIQRAERRAALGDFARQANHDIKNGLTPIRNVFRHLGEVSGEAGQLQSVFEEREGTIASGIDYLERLSTEYARLSTRPVPQPLELSSLFREIGLAFASVDSRVAVGRMLSAVVLADPLAVRRVVENLVSNALQSLGEGPGSVILSMALPSEGNAVELVVRDSGEGIPDSVREHLFEDFFTTREGGAGLGLSIVRRLVMDMTGSIRVDSVPGKGASFIIRLPLLDRS